MAVDGCHAAGAPAGSVRAFVFQKRMHDPCKTAYGRSASFMHAQKTGRSEAVIFRWYGAGMLARERVDLGIGHPPRVVAPCPGPDRGCHRSCRRVLHLLFRR